MTQLLVAAETTYIAAQTDDSRFQNPALLYLMGLGSAQSRKTMHSNLSWVAHYLDEKDLNSFPWASLRQEHVLAVREKLRSLGRSPATINTYLAAVKGVAREAWSLNQIDTDIFQRIKHVKSQRGSRVAKGRALAPDEIKQLLEACKNDPTARGVRDLAILSILIGCGLRRAELVSLRYEDFDTVQGYLSVIGKGNKERLAFLPQQALTYLQRWVEEVRGDYTGPLFTRIRRNDDITENPITSQAIYNIVENRRLDANLKLFAPHDLRRTFASMLLENGEDISTVKDAMGHASLTTTQRYDKRGNQRLQQASQRMVF